MARARQQDNDVVTLFVAGASPHSSRAVMAARQWVSANSGCRLKVIDIYRRPDRAREHGVVAIPALLHNESGTVVTFAAGITHFDQFDKKRASTNGHDRRR